MIMIRYLLIGLCLFLLLNCTKTRPFVKQKLVQFEMVAIPTLISSPVAITEERILNELYSLGFKETIVEKEYLLKIESELQKLIPSDIHPKYSSSFMFSGLLYFEESNRGIYLSFTAFEGKYYMYYDKRLCEWNQELANLIYEKIPDRIMSTVYEDML